MGAGGPRSSVVKVGASRDEMSQSWSSTEGIMFLFLCIYCIVLNTNTFSLFMLPCGVTFYLKLSLQYKVIKC